jgi:hypothetical protein
MVDSGFRDNVSTHHVSPPASENECGNLGWESLSLSCASLPGWSGEALSSSESSETDLQCSRPQSASSPVSLGEDTLLWMT